MQAPGPNAHAFAAIVMRILEALSRDDLRRSAITSCLEARH